MRLILLKAQKFANQAGYFLQNGRWHKTSQDKPAPKGAPVSAHPHAAGKPVQKETLAEHEWSQLKLPAENSNAGTFNKQLDQLKAAAAAGDVTGILGSGYGTNTYGKKLAIIANHVLGLLGSDHKVTPGQKAGSHAAVQTAPEIEAEAPAAKPEAPKAKPVSEAPTGGKALTSNQKAIVEGIENYLGLKLNAAYVKNNVINIETDGLQQHNLHAIENYGTQFGKFKAEPGGHKKISLVLTKQSTANEKKAVEKPAPAPEKKASTEPPVSEKKADAELAVPEFAEGKQAKGVKAHYEKVAKKIIRAAKAGDLSALQFMPSDKGNTWKGKTDNSKKLIELHQAAIAHAEAQKGPGKDVQHPDAEKQAAQEEKELAKEQVTPEKKPEPKKQDTQPAAEQGPKEGETKDGADGTLVFKNGRWHKQGETPKAEQKPAAKEQPKGDAAGNLSQIPWDNMLLPDSNKNAKSHNKQIAKIKAMAEAGDIEGLKNFKAGTNTYGKKQNLLAQTALAALEESAPAPKAEKVPPTSSELFSGMTKPPEFKDKAEFVKWFWGSGYENMEHEGIAKYGSVAAWNASPEVEYLDTLSEKYEGADGSKEPAPVEKPKAEKASDAGIPKPPKMDAFNHGQVAKQWVKFAQEGKSQELMDSISTLAGNAKKTPEKFSDPDSVKLMQFAGEMANWAANNMAAPADEPEAKRVKIPKLPEFKSFKEMEDWTDTPAHKEWNEALLAKYGSKEAAFTSPEAEKFNDLYIELFDKKDAKPAATSKPQKPTGLTSVHWSSTVNEIETAMQAGNEPYLMNMVQQTAGLTSAEAKAVHDYAVSAAGYVQDQKQGDSAENDGPQEGETKQGANGMLVFKNGRWHKMDEGAQSLKQGWMDAVKSGNVPTKAQSDYVENLKNTDEDAHDELFSQVFDGIDPDDDKFAEIEANVQALHNKGLSGQSSYPPAPAGPADVEIPTFNGPNATHNEWLKKAAEALKEKVIAEGKDGLKQPLTNHKNGMVTVNIAGVKVAKASVTSSNPAIASFAQFVDELKASVGKAKKAKPAPKATQAPAPAAEPEQPKPIESMDHWEQTGGQGGSNPGGKFKDENGVEWYCKFPENDHIAKAEVLAAKLYSALGLNAQDAKIVTKDGKVGIASRWQDVKKASPKELAQTPGVLEGFAADAWLANWDVVGLAYDNLQVDNNGHAMRVDAGGSLMYRAQGSKKAFGEHVTELDSLRDPKINPQAAAVFGKMSEADITASVAKVAQISDAQIRIMVNNFGPGDKAERKALAETLIARKNDLIAKYPKAVKVKKKRLDPENLPVKEERLPKEHDFANWNGPGAGLSSKAAVNAANQKVESEMLAIAKSGNLNKLKDYKFTPVSVANGEPFGEPLPIAQHPSKHVQQFHQDLIQALDEIANPPQPLKIFQESDLNTLDELDMAFPSKKFGTTVNSVQSNEKMGFWVVLGGVHKAAEKFAPKKITHFTTQAIDAAYQKFKEGSKLAKHFILSVQASGSYNDLFREGKEFDHAGNKLSDVAKAALEFATEQPEGTAVYRYQQMTKDMVDKIMSAPDGTVFQATGPMCTSMSPTATSHFGPHRIKIVYAKGAKAVESFGSGKFAGEKEVTTLPNSRFVILKKELVPGGSGKRMELEVLMLPPDIGL